MVGPVLYQEMLLGGRRNRAHVFRWIYVVWLLLQLLGYFSFFLLQTSMLSRRPADFTDLRAFAEDYTGLLVGQHFILLLLATPVLAAGAITDEKSRGTLQYLLTADLTPWEILSGKLIGRSCQVLVLLLPVLPLLCFFATFAGLEADTLLAILAGSVVLLLAVASASLLASVWCRHTRDAVLALLTLGTVTLLLAQGLRSALAGPLPWLADLLGFLNPFYLATPEWRLDGPAARWRRILGFGLVWGTLGGGCLALAAARLRDAYLRQLEGEGKKKKKHWWRAARAPLRGDPIRWKERHVEGIAPLAVLRRLPRWLGIGLVSTATVLSCGSILLECLPSGVTPAMLWQMVLELDLGGLFNVAFDLAPSGAAFYSRGYMVMLLAGLVIGIRCSGAVTGEREKQTWEALLLTPLTTRELIRGKLWGILGASFPYLLAYAVPALLLSALGGPVSLFWTALWLAVTCLALYYVGAAGLWCSVRSKTSWRSLLGTLGFTYLGGFVLFCVISALAGFLAIFIMLLLTLLDQFAGSGSARAFLAGLNAYYLAFCIALALVFFFLAWRLVVAAEYRVGILERTKHWKDEHLYDDRPRRRRRERP